MLNLSASSFNVNCEISPISRPATLTDNDSFLSFLPLQLGHGDICINCDTRFLIRGLCVVAKDLRTKRLALVKVPL